MKLHIIIIGLLILVLQNINCLYPSKPDLIINVSKIFTAAPQIMFSSDGKKIALNYYSKDQCGYFIEVYKINGQMMCKSQKLTYFQRMLSFPEDYGPITAHVDWILGNSSNQTVAMPKLSLWSTGCKIQYSWDKKDTRLVSPLTINGTKPIVGFFNAQSITEYELYSKNLIKKYTLNEDEQFLDDFRYSDNYQYLYAYVKNKITLKQRILVFDCVNGQVLKQFSFAYPINKIINNGKSFIFINMTDKANFWIYNFETNTSSYLVGKPRESLPYIRTGVCTEQNLIVFTYPKNQTAVVLVYNSSTDNPDQLLQTLYTKAYGLETLQMVCSGDTLAFINQVGEIILYFYKDQPETIIEQSVPYFWIIIAGAAALIIGIIFGILIHRIISRKQHKDANNQNLPKINSLISQPLLYPSNIQKQEKIQEQQKKPKKSKVKKDQQKFMNDQQKIAIKRKKKQQIHPFIKDEIQKAKPFNIHNVNQKDITSDPINNQLPKQRVKLYRNSGLSNNSQRNITAMMNQQRQQTSNGNKKGTDRASSKIFTDQGTSWQDIKDVKKKRKEKQRETEEYKQRQSGEYRRLEEEYQPKRQDLIKRRMNQEYQKEEGQTTQNQHDY